MSGLEASYSRVPLVNGIIRITIKSIYKGVERKTVRNIWTDQKTGEIIVSIDHLDLSEGYIRCHSHEHARNVVRDAHAAAYCGKGISRFSYENINNK